MSVEGVAERMQALLRERPHTFYELVRRLEDVEYRTILQSWGLLRERRALGRDTHGRYVAVAGRAGELRRRSPQEPG